MSFSQNSQFSQFSQFSSPSFPSPPAPPIIPALLFPACLAYFWEADSRQNVNCG